MLIDERNLQNKQTKMTVLIKLRIIKKIKANRLLLKKTQQQQLKYYRQKQTSHFFNKNVYLKLKTKLFRQHEQLKQKLPQKN